MLGFVNKFETWFPGTEINKMSSEQHPFTKHQQLVDPLSECHQQGMEMRNHKVYLNNRLGRRYFRTKEQELKDWIQTNKITIWIAVRGGIHSAVVDQWDDDDQLELEMDLKEYLGDDIPLAIAAAERAQQLAKNLVAKLEMSRQIELDGWDAGLNYYTEDTSPSLEDTRPLLGEDQTEDTSWMGLRRRLMGV